MSIANCGSTAVSSRWRTTVQNIAQPVADLMSTVEDAGGDAQTATAIAPAEVAKGDQPATNATARHPFTPAARPLWDGIPPAAQERILDNVRCGHCRASRRIANFIGVAQKGNLRLQGFCSACGCVVARVIETGEAPS